MPDPTLIAGTASAVIGVRVAETILDKAVNYVADKLKERGEKELADRFARLRSDHKLRAQIQAATERAVERWTSDHPDRDLTLVLTRDTQFVDLPSVRDAIAIIAQRPFDSIAAETLRGKFSNVLPARFDSARVERGVIAFLEILREELAGVADLRDALKTAADIQTARATQQSAATLDAILRRIEHGPTPTDETLQNYLNWVIDQHRYLDPRGTMQTVRQVQVLLDEIYVSLQAEAEPPMGDARDRRVFERELDELSKRDDLRAEEKEDLYEILLGRYARGNVETTRRVVAELAELVREKNKLVILGDPGAGKTTLMRYLALRHAQAMKRGETTMTDLGATRLPLYLRLANYAENRDNRSLADFLPTSIRGDDDGDPALATLIRERLAQGACLVLLDGLDEVIAPDERAQIAAQADALIRAYENAGNRFVVTSRVAGYRTAPLAGDLLHYTVCEMNDEQIKRFLDCWCHAVERFQTPDLSPDAQNAKAQAEIDGITDAITKNPGVRRLSANPLLLRVLALIHRTGARLPQRRIELYRLAADTLIRDWELARGIPQAALVNEAEANRLLAELAAWMHEN
ncbi:MAG: NACHT domain-containing protein [Chloroflexi bacterium]|nr:NACHT domain-containing protein [Chloroflexota bacterium]